VQHELQELERYVHDALGATVKTAPWRGAGNLPQVLRERYKFAQAELLGLRAFSSLIPNPRSSRQQRYASTWTCSGRQQADLIYVRAQVTAYNRKRLIEQKVPFIVPSNQMYLPLLAIDLREHFRRIREKAPPSAHPRRLWSSIRCSAMQGRC